MTDQEWRKEFCAIWERAFFKSLAEHGIVVGDGGPDERRLANLDDETILEALAALQKKVLG